MGDMAEYYLDQMLACDEYHAEREHRLQQQGIWITKDNREIKITDMTESHLLNSLKMCKQNECASWVQLFREEIARRHEAGIWGH